MTDRPDRYFVCVYKVGGRHKRKLEAKFGPYTKAFAEEWAAKCRKQVPDTDMFTADVVIERDCRFDK